jgi:hypothetical protein
MFKLIIFILNVKRKVIELSLKEITIRSDNKFTMQCYNTVTELQCSVIILMKFLVVRCKLMPKVNKDFCIKLFFVFHSDMVHYETLI